MNKIYRPRKLTELGIWKIEGLRFKVYGITAKGQVLTQTIVKGAREFVQSDALPLIEAQGDDNGLGFIIIHFGEDLGMSILVHWWIQGSILCQHIQRKIWGIDTPVDTANRPVIACVWELGIINAEQNTWRETMMNANPDATAYLNTRGILEEV